MTKFHHTKALQKGDRVTVRLSDGYVGRATVMLHWRPDSQSPYPATGYMKVLYDDGVRRVRTIDEWLATPLEPLDLLAEISDVSSD